MLGVSMMTLHRHVVAKKIEVPPVQNIGGTTFRSWTARDVERVRRQMLKIKDGRRTNR